MTVESKTGSKSVSSNRKPQEKSKFKKFSQDKSRTSAAKKSSRFGDKTTTKKSSSRFNDDSNTYRDNSNGDRSGSNEYENGRKNRFESDDQRKDVKNRTNRFEDSRDSRDRDFPKKRAQPQTDDRGDHRFGNENAKDKRPAKFQRPFEKRGNESSRNFSKGRRDGDKPRSYNSDKSDFKRTDRSFERRPDRSSDRGFERRPDRSSDRSFERRPDRSSDRSFERRPERSSDRSFERRPERSSDRGFERRPERSSDRSFERRPERSSDRSFERRPERSSERSFERKPERSSDKGFERRPERSASDRGFERRPERSASDRGFERRPDRSSDRGFERSPERSSERSFERRPDRGFRETFNHESNGNRTSSDSRFKRDSRFSKTFDRNSTERNNSTQNSYDRSVPSADKFQTPKVSLRRQELLGQESPRPFSEKPKRIGPISRTEQDPRTRPIGKRLWESQIEGPCQIKNECRSCLYVNLPYESSLKLKHGDGIRKLDVFLGKAIIHEPVPSPKPLYYRTHVKLAVRRNPEGGADIGLFEPGSHKVVNLDHCPVQSGVINHFIKKFRMMVDTMGLEPYDESSGEGWLRYIAIRVAHLTGELMVSLIVTRHDEALGKKIHQFLRKNEEKFSSLHFNIQPEKGNAIWGEETIHIGGEKTLSESLCGLKFEISPQSFFQINPWQAQNLYRTVERYAANPTGQPVAWDLYSGCGQITMLLSRAGYRALGIEEIPAAVENAKSNSLRNKLSSEFILGRVEDNQFKLPTWAQKPSVIVANPSRRGMAETTRKVLAGVATEYRSTLIYVSCDVDTLARDLKDLTDGGLKVRQVHAFDMFAQTAGLEWLVVLTP